VAYDTSQDRATSGRRTVPDTVERSAALVLLAGWQLRRAERVERHRELP
jgi:hypothetical protein